MNQTIKNVGNQEQNLVVRMEGISKQFPGVKALDGCRFDLRAGEVHALVGENGAGKSTLMKILAGVYRKDEGSIYFQNREVNFGSTRDAIKTGISIIHQELQLIPHLSVAENIFIGHEPFNALGKIHIGIDRKELLHRAEELITHMNLRLDTGQRVSELSVAGQFMVEIAKAVAQEPKVLIMDEPTSALTQNEAEDLFRLIREMCDRGMGIVYISHRMEELKQISDRVTIMRDGKFITTRDTQEISIAEMIKLMVGREVFSSAPELPEHPSDEIVLEVQNLRCGDLIKDASFQLHRGEILGISGLVGAGRTELARAIYGADKFDSGEVLISGKPVKIRHPFDAVRCGLCYLSEDRKRYGLVLERDIEANSVLASYASFALFKFIVKRKMTRQAAEGMVKSLSISTPSITQLVSNLSGGNQQKVVIARWLIKNCDILIIDEPTRGIDVAAKNEIYKLLNSLVKEGKSIIMISSELPEIMRMSHRILVMCEGRITGILSASETTPEQIMQYATQRDDIEGSDDKHF